MTDKEIIVVKSYLSILGYIYELDRVQLDVLYQLVTRMVYQNTIVVNKSYKEMISEEAGVSVRDFNKAISKFVENGLFEKKYKDVYTANPELFGMGGFRYIKEIKTQITHTPDSLLIKPEIIYSDID